MTRSEDQVKESGDVTMYIDGEPRAFKSTAWKLQNDQEWAMYDADLRSLVMLCQAVNITDRPSLDFLRRELEKQFSLKTEEYYPNFGSWFSEKTRDIQLLINKFIFEPAEFTDRLYNH